MLPTLRYPLPRMHMQSHSPISRRSTSSKAILPRLPVPDLHQTLQRYLKSLEPFLLEDERLQGRSFDSNLAVRALWAEDFAAGLGKVCQSRLQALDRDSPNNWLDDNIWLRKAYHEWRAPLLVGSNWWLSFKNDPNIPQEVLTGRQQSTLGQTGLTPWQVRRATWLSHRVLEFREQLQRQQIYPDTTKTGIWFRTSTDRMFNIARLPRMQCDTSSKLPSKMEPYARSILVFIHDWLYAVEVIDADQNLISPRGLETRIRSVILDVDQRLCHSEAAVPISVLGADHRDRWAENQRHLLSLSPQNSYTLEAINHTIFGLSLDHYTYVIPFSSADSPIPPPNSSLEVDAHLHNLRSSHPSYPARNRWHDKPFTLIVESNTRAGAHGEHSPVDALVPSIVTEYAAVQAIDDDVFGGSVHESTIVSVTDNKGWSRLDWVVDEHIRQECVAAETRARAIVDDSDDSVLRFAEYGAEWIKDTAGLSPDAYVQMAMQLAWYRTQQSFTATYETALTRIFHHGRTETIRTFSSDARAWVLAMDNPSTSLSTRLRLLQTAIKTHSGLTRTAATGRGIDRHLLGLRCMMQPGESHELFEDELFTRSQTWKLSTSGLSAGYQFRGTGFGSPEHDGYGINYLTGPESITFGIESKHSCPHTSTQGFKLAITTALRDMYQLCITAAAPRL